ncbi:unnamed protein product [Adineta steineri]|uniref:Uncharacterized protein n=1 Tax=Adineta steineri TaxID=433720 RepID=A0A814SEZ4_9BILA|nr:unnamed protein product [Adineta steineri]CAF4175355.1 unnamed protein product [Adineta steineri]
MAAANVQAITLNDYDYIDEDSIDCELKCSLCIQPFQVPVSATCGHTFCHVCTSQWVARQSTCPTCRIRTSTEDFRPISTRIVLNQLERLLMKCKRCNKTNIQRGNISEHEQQCPNQTVSCPAFSIKCPWKGTRNDLTEHIQQCSYQKIRPVIDDIYEHLKNIYEPLVDELQTVRQQLEKQLQHNNEQNRFLLAVFNKGKPMSDRCSGHSQFGGCQIQRSIQRDKSVKVLQSLSDYKTRSRQQQPEVLIPSRPINEFNTNLPGNNSLNCANCQNSIDPGNVALHHCEGGCICRTCLENYGSLDR